MTRRNKCRVDAAVTVDGRLFHALAAATRNARSPSDDLLVAGTTSDGELDDLRRCLMLSGLHSSDLLKLVRQVTVTVTLEFVVRLHSQPEGALHSQYVVGKGKT